MTSIDEVDKGDAASEEKVSGANCASGSCPLSNKRVMAFLLPFLGALAFEQFAANSNSCISAPFCQMCVVTKTMVPVLAGLVGLAFQKAFLKTSK
jgi:hypothetical protein